MRGSGMGEEKEDHDEGAVHPAVSDKTDVAAGGQQPEQHVSDDERAIHNRRAHAFIFGYIILLVLSVIGGATYAYWHKHERVNVALSVRVAAKPPTTVLFKTPEQLNTDLHFFQNYGALFGYTCSSRQTTNCPTDVSAADIRYYQIGLTQTKQPIVVAAYINGDGSQYYTAIENTPKHYEILGNLEPRLNPSNPSDASIIQTIHSALSTNVSLNTSGTLAALTFPNAETLDNDTFTVAGPGGYFINGLDTIRSPDLSPLDPSTIRTLGTAGGKTFYEVMASDKTDYQIKELYGTANGVFAAAYTPIDSLNGTIPPEITWNNSPADNTSTYTSTEQSCGSTAGYAVTKDVTAAQLTPAGLGPTGLPIYELGTATALFNKIFNTGYAHGQHVQEDGLRDLSAQQFQADHAVIVAQNGLGEYVIYTRTDMLPSGICG
jgi:hypothetical protein